MKMRVKVVTRVKNNNFVAISTASDNIYNNHSLYEVNYPDGEAIELEYNVIVDNMMYQVDSEGHHYQAISEISDHKFDNSAIKKCNEYVKSKNGNIYKKSLHVGAN